MKKKNYFFGIIILFLIFTIPQLYKPFILDEIDVIQSSEALIRTGSPTYYRSEDFPEWTFAQHPPLYTIFLGFALVYPVYFEIMISVFIFSIIYVYRYNKRREIELETKGAVPNENTFGSTYF